MHQEKNLGPNRWSLPSAVDTGDSRCGVVNP